ncbi:unnamed protein product [Allacma fusca]|uniref:Protein kinase domain-containing protein n=1 Tax=Allacma fusca TaxID=39272 RepID=A0A8J2PI49_9HEXA|nr:unnamed protein product [Allacma fusca]
MGNQTSSNLNEFQELLRAIRKDALSSQVDEEVAQNVEDATIRTDASITEDLRSKSIAEVIKTDEVEAVNEVLEDGGLSVNDAIGRPQATPLHLAAYYGSSNTLKYFLSLRDIKIDIRTTEGDTPAMYALYGAQNDEDALAILEPFLTVKRDNTLSSFAVKNNNLIFPLCISIQKHFVKCSKFLSSKTMIKIYDTKDIIFVFKLALATNQENLADSIRGNLGPQQETEVLQEIRGFQGLTAQLEDLVDYLQRTYTGSSAAEEPDNTDTENEDDEQEKTLKKAMSARHFTVEDAAGNPIRVGDIVKTLSAYKVQFVLPEGTSEAIAKRLADQMAVVHEITGDKAYMEILGKNILTRLKASAIVLKEEGKKQQIGDGTIATIGMYVQVLAREDELRKFAGASGWVHGMEETCGKTGRVVRFSKANDLLVQFAWNARYFYKPNALQQSSEDKIEMLDASGKYIREETLVQVSKFRSDFESSQKQWNLPFDKDYAELPWKYALVDKILLKAFSPSKTVKILCKNKHFEVNAESLKLVEVATDRAGKVIRIGDKVKLIDDQFALKAAQKPEFGGWIVRMAEFMGQMGKVTAMVPDKDKSSSLMVKVEFHDSSSFYFNPRCVVVSKEVNAGPSHKISSTNPSQSEKLEKIDRGSLQCFEILGEGAFGSVVRGSWNHGEAKKIVAIKQIKIGVTSDVTMDELMSEASTQYSLRHPNIVTLYGISYQRDLWIIMDFVDGSDLFEILHAKKNKVELPVERKIELALDMSRAISYIHQKGYLHCDIKPHNMMVDRTSGKLYVCDFGITRYLGSVDIFSFATQYTNSVSGTLYYIPPECLRQDEVGRYKKPSFNSDVWALGAVFYELFTGAHLYINHMKFLQDKMDNKDQVVKNRLPDVPTQVRSIVARALDYNYKARPTAQELCEFFHELK